MQSIAISLLGVLLLSCCPETVAGEPIDVGSGRELFVDRRMVGALEGTARLRLHRPQPREVVLVTDRPWEGNTCAYYTIFQDGEIYRMYYRGSHFDEATGKATHREVTCYAESRDGIVWKRPELGLFAFAGSRANNIVWDGIGTHCFTPFRDTNPDCPPGARYKAVARGRPRGEKGLYAFSSPDGIHWSPMRDEPVITTGAFDSQNTAFWDEHTGQYREYHRTFHEGVRAIMTGTSPDFLVWTDPVLLEYGAAPREHLYTNAIRPYHRAPHILIGFPTRYLPDEGQRVEPILMASRDGRIFHRWRQALIPQDAPEDRDGNRSNYMTWGLVELPGEDRECSVYATEAYYSGPDSRVRRFTFRLDGFVSVSAGHTGGELVTTPLIFRGKSLEINLVTRGAGGIRVELLDATGKPISPFTLAHCEPVRGDAIDRRISWGKGADLGALAGQTVKLRFELEDADLFSFRFRDPEEADGGR